MKLFSFKPDCFGPYSFFVMAQSKKAAMQAVNKYIKKEKLDEYDIEGWNTDDYIVTVLDENEVITNNNS